MILTLWLALLSLAVVICILGYFTGDEPYLTVGLFVLFLLGIIVLNGLLEYQTGETKEVSFNYTNATLSSQFETTSFTYTAWNDSTSHQVGWGLAIISAIGVALSLYNTRKKRLDNA